MIFEVKGPCKLVLETELTPDSWQYEEFPLVPGDVVVKARNIMFNGELSKRFFVPRLGMTGELTDINAILEYNPEHKS